MLLPGDHHRVYADMVVHVVHFCKENGENMFSNGWKPPTRHTGIIELYTHFWGIKHW